MPNRVGSKSASGFAMKSRQVPNAVDASGSVSGSTRVKTGHRRVGSKSHRGTTSNGRRPKSKSLSARTESRGSRAQAPPENDLEDILQEVAEIEARMQEAIQNLQAEVTNSSNYMLDAIMTWSTAAHENVRDSLNEVQALRDANQKTDSQCNILNGI